MAETKKKIVKVSDTEEGKAAAEKISKKTKEAVASGEVAEFKPTAESKTKALHLRIFAVVLWVLAIGCEVAAILLLRNPPITMWLMIALIVADLGLAVAGSMLWKKSNRLDPAKKSETVKFFVQNQLGLIISIIAFLPLIILILTNKDLEGKQKGILAAIGVVALLGAGALGMDLNPPSVEQYTEQMQEVDQLTGQSEVFWTKSGTKYHLYADCQHINTDKTAEIFSGTVPQARELKNITELCATCRSKALKANPAAADNLDDADDVDETNETDEEADDADEAA